MNNQKINCSVCSCRFHNGTKNLCELEQIKVLPCENCSTGNPKDESMCGSYQIKQN